jgi:hypothetical protein
LFADVLNTYSKLPSNEVDRDYLSILVGQLTDIRAVELLPAIKQLFVKSYINMQHVSALPIIEQEIKKPIGVEVKLEIMDIVRRYGDVYEEE